MGWEISGNSGLLVPNDTPTVCWDLDSTLRSSVQRRYLLPEVRAGRKTWDDYSHLAKDDAPIPGSVALLRLLNTFTFGVFNVAVTGASDATLQMTRDWCKEYDVPLDEFMMRPAFDETENGVWKVSCVRKLQAAGMDVQLFVEDWEPIARYIAQETDIPVLGINPFDPDAMTLTQDNLGEVLDTLLGAEGMAYDPGTGPELAENVFKQARKRRETGV